MVYIGVNIFVWIKTKLFSGASHGNATTEYPGLNESINQGNEYSDDARALREKPDQIPEIDRQINEAIDNDAEITRKIEEIQKKS